MKWVNHILLATAPAAVINPVLVPAAALGATAPDWMEWVGNALGMRIKHRTVTHYAVLWAVLCVFFGLVWDIKGIGLGFAFGGLSHVLADSLTVMGVPFGPWSDRRFHMFGGRMRTGDPGEYVVSAAVVVVCAALFALLGFSGWYPFFYDWAGYFDQGLVDGAEWRTNRFKLM